MKPVFQSALRAASAGPTCVYEPSRRAFAELFGLVRQSDLDDPGDVSGRRLHPDGMRRDQLEKEGKGGGKKSVRRNTAAPDQDNATHNHWNNSERFFASRRVECCRCAAGSACLQRASAANATELFFVISFREVLQEPFCLSCNPKFISVNGSDGLHLHFIKWLKLLWAVFTFRFYFCISPIAGLQSFCSFQLTYKSSIDWNPVNRHMKLWLVMTAVSQKRHGGTKGEERPEENSVVPSSRNSWRHVMLKHGGRVQRNVCNRI